MLIEFRNADRMYAVKALGVYRKGIESAKTACEKVYADTSQLLIADAGAEAVEQWITDKLDEMGAGEVRDVSMAGDLVLALRTACSVYRTQLGKLEEKQTDLLVSTTETDLVISHLMSLTDRLMGQTELSGDITLGFGNTTVTITPESAARGSDNVARILANGEKPKRKRGVRSLEEESTKMLDQAISGALKEAGMAETAPGVWMPEQAPPKASAVQPVTAQ